MDGTFAYAAALGNIQRSLDKKRKVELYYIYQDPVTAWDFTKRREAIEGRRVSKDVFITAFFISRQNVNAAKARFKDAIELNLIIKDFKRGIEQLELNITGVDTYLKKHYTKLELKNLL